jgi:hypothetical protein
MAGFCREELAIAREEVDRPGTVWKPPYGRYAGPAFMALRHTRLGQREIAMQFLERAFESRHHLIASLNVNPLWDELRTDRRFEDLVRRIGLAH